MEQMKFRQMFKGFSLPRKFFQSRHDSKLNALWIEDLRCPQYTNALVIVFEEQKSAMKEALRHSANSLVTHFYKDNTRLTDAEFFSTIFRLYGSLTGKPLNEAREYMGEKSRKLFWQTGGNLLIYDNTGNAVRAFFFFFIEYFLFPAKKEGEKITLKSYFQYLWIATDVFVYAWYCARREKEQEEGRGEAPLKYLGPGPNVEEAWTELQEAVNDWGELIWHHERVCEDFGYGKPPSSPYHVSWEEYFQQISVQPTVPKLIGRTQQLLPATFSPPLVSALEKEFCGKPTQKYFTFLVFFQKFYWQRAATFSWIYSDVHQEMWNALKDYQRVGQLLDKIRLLLFLPFTPLEKKKVAERLVVEEVLSSLS